MKVIRKRHWKSGKLNSVIKLDLSDEERRLIANARLMDMKIQTHDGSFLGKTLSLPGIQRGFEANIRRIRDRWSVAMVRTSGSVLIDFAILYLKLIGSVFGLFFRFVFGSRKTVHNLIYGIKFSSKRVEDVKEFEVFVFLSVAALMRAIQFANTNDEEDTLDGDEVLAQLAGLSFTAANTTKFPLGRTGMARGIAGGDYEYDEAFEESEDEHDDEEDMEIDLHD